MKLKLIFALCEFGRELSPSPTSPNCLSAIRLRILSPEGERLGMFYQPIACRCIRAVPAGAASIIRRVT